MNTERLLKLADTVEKGTGKFGVFTTAFNMEAWFADTTRWAGGVPELDTDFVDEHVPKREDVADPYACNSVACIAGFTVLLFEKESIDAKRTFDVSGRARELLDLNDTDARHLFMGRTHKYVSGAQAAEVIRHFVATGVVAWSKFTDM